MLVLRHSFISTLAFIAFALTARAQTVFVDSLAVSGNNDGSSWSNAFTHLQSALAVANSGDEIWVAQGVYTPAPTASANDSFHLKDGLKLYGGFVGGETSLAQRDWVAHPTILSGDVNQDDQFGSPWYVGWNIVTANSAHVVTAIDVASAVLDGFTISGGSTGPSGTPAGAPEMSGGGIYAIRSSLAIEHCVFEHNLAAFGAGASIYLYDSSPAIRFCIFRDSWVHLGSGAGIFSAGASVPLIEDCTFSGNVVTCYNGQEGQGGAISLHWNTPPTRIVRCVFDGNTARAFGGSTFEIPRGGGISSFTDGVVIADCVFRNNSATFGAGLFTWGSTQIVNCLFEENSVYNVLTSSTTISGHGSAIGTQLYPGDFVSITNSTIARNHVVGGESGAVFGFGFVPVQVRNSILWGNTAPSGVLERRGNYGGNVDLFDSCVGGLFVPNLGDPPPLPSEVPGCISADPQFANFASSDYHLLGTSPCVDAGSNGFLPGFASLDLEANQRVVQGTSSFDVDMGAYEFGSVIPGPCPTIVNAPAPQSYFVGQSATMSVLAMGAPLTYRWRKNGSPLVNSSGFSGVTTSELQIAPVQSTHAGDYDVVIGSTCGPTVTLSATLTVDPTPPGQVFCSGDGSAVSCPCGNDKDFGEGCENSTGEGARLRGSGSTSVALDDAVLSATFLPSDKSAIFFMGVNWVNGGNGNLFGDGLLCVTPTHRFPILNSGPNGTVNQVHAAAHAPQQVQAGATLLFQVWYRDPSGPCGNASNTSNGYRIDFTP